MMNDYTGCGEIPLVAGEITGYRAWRVALATPALYSCTRMSNLWFPGINVASCLVRNSRIGIPNPLHRAPHRPCTCGFYARTEDDQHGFSYGIQGVVRSSGRIILGAKGYRAEKSRIVALYRTEISDDFFTNGVASVMWSISIEEAFDILSGIYQVPILESREEAFECFPPDDLSSFRRSQHEVVTARSWNGEPSIVIRNAMGQIVFHNNNPQSITGRMTITPYTQL